MPDSLSKGILYPYSVNGTIQVYLIFMVYMSEENKQRNKYLLITGVIYTLRCSRDSLQGT